MSTLYLFISILHCCCIEIIGDQFDLLQLHRLVLCYLKYTFGTCICMLLSKKYDFYFKLMIMLYMNKTKLIFLLISNDLTLTVSSILHMISDVIFILNAVHFQIVTLYFFVSICRNENKLAEFFSRLIRISIELYMKK